ncbi:hypothetical protein H9Q69_008239 [Fusarium xylarioides]|nr:hypothetical protein H9Q69_008239 [Fusarium xylarioides]KAG5806929.1 hypothetical protein H9Q71_008497 [Fusarium xylarioides]KAG5825161.1 hypothetical protein H9Q74_004731 [Fusarium xylarioides]
MASLVVGLASKKDPPPVVRTKPTNINLGCPDEPTTILCREIEDINLNLLLTRITGICYQTSDWRKSVVDEAKHTLLCLADRRQVTGGRRVVTNEHLTRALYYFDVRMLLADVDDNHADPPRCDFFRDFYNDCNNNNGAPENLQSPSENKPSVTALMSPKPKPSTQNAAPSATVTTAGTKRRASEDLRDERFNRSVVFNRREMEFRARERRQSREREPRGSRR